jgi:hypothetical protein
VLSIAAEFYRKIGDLESSGRLVKRQASIARDRTIAARHYMKLLPANWLSKLQGQMLDQMLIQFPDEIADEVRSIFEEIYGRGRFEQYMLEILVKYYSTAELLALARYMGSPEGQSSLQKQPLILQETMTFGAAEFQRVLRKRHPELFEDAEPGQNLEAAQPNPLLATGGIGEPVLLGAGGDSDGDSETDN